MVGKKAQGREMVRVAPMPLADFIAKGFHCEGISLQEALLNVRISWCHECLGLNEAKP